MKKALLALALTAIFSSASSADLYWDSNAATPGAGTTPNGTWGTSTFWSTDSTGAVATAGWTSGQTAVFSAGTDATGSYTVTVNATQTAGGITIEEGTVTITNGTSPGTADVGTGTVTLNSGTTLITNSSARINVAPGGKYQLNGSATLRTTNTGNLGSFIDSEATILLTNNATLTADFQVTAPVGTAPMSIIQTATAISGSGSFVKTGGGIVGLASANTYSGSTTVEAGELRLRNTNNRLPDTTDVIVNGSGILNMAGLSDTVASLSGNGGSVGLAGATLTLAGNTGDKTYAGVIANTAFIPAATAGGTTGVGAITKNGASTLFLTGSNTFTGTLTIGNTAGNIVSVGNGGTSGSFAGNFATTTNGALHFNRSNDSSYNGLISGAGAVTKLGAGGLTLSRADGNTYSGGTVVNAGTLTVANTTGSATGTGAVTVNNGGTLGGTGSVGGAVTVANGATVAPGASPGTLAINNAFVLNPASTLAYELNGANTTVGGGVNDFITGVTNLTLDGVLNVSETGSGTFLADAGDGDKWTLITYSGTLTDNGLAFGSMPPLGAGLMYSIEAMAGQVNLLVTAVPEAGSFIAVGFVGLLSAGAVWIRKRRAGQLAA